MVLKIPGYLKLIIGIGDKMRKNISLLLIQKGFSLIEVLIAIFVLAIILVATVSIFATSYMGIIYSGHESKEIYNIQQQLEEKINNSDYDFEGNIKMFFMDDNGQSYPIPSEGIDVGIIKQGSLMYITSK